MDVADLWECIRLLATWVWIFLKVFTRVYSEQVLDAVLRSGVAAYEAHPAYFWLVWLPGAYYSWVVFVRWFMLTLCPFVFWLFWVCIGRRLTLGWLLEVAAAWCLRGSRAPPPVLRGEGVADPSMGQLASGRGIHYSQVANVTHASVAAGGLTPSRCRSRARWVRVLEDYLGGRPGIVGQLVKGRWEPDLPLSSRPLSANSLLALLDCDAKLLGGGVLPTGYAEHEVFLVVETATGRHTVAPRLFARLAQYACFRPRTQELLAGMRSRANEWFKEKTVAPEAAALVLPSTVELAFSQTAPERLSRERLDDVLVCPPLQ